LVALIVGAGSALGQTTTTVTGVSPSSGSVAGGTTVTITGSGFTGATAVDFGGTPATSFTFVSDTQITAVAPAVSAPVTVDVTVVVGGVSSATSPADQFTYTPAPPPTVTTGSPSGLTQTTVTLNGSLTASGQPITNCRFQYGTGNRFNRSAACQYGSAGTTVNVSANVTGLAPATTYRYRLVAATAEGSSTSAAATFTTLPLPVLGAPRVGLLLVRMTGSQYLAELLGIDGITGAAIGESLVLRCVAACQHPFGETIPLRTNRDMTRRIGFPRGLLLSTATRINIDATVKGQVSRYAIYAFYLSRGALAVKVASSGCVSGTRVLRCPGPPPAAPAQ